MKQPNTSNDFNDDGEEMLYNDGFKQGYAKALDDVTKIIKECFDKVDYLEDFDYNGMMQEIAKLEKK